MSLLRQSLPWGLAMMVSMWLITAFFDLGLTRSAYHFDKYFGSLSWLQYRVVFRPVGTGRQPAPTDFVPTLRYGFNLAYHAALHAEVLQTEMPLSQVAPLLYDTTGVPNGFSPDTVYDAVVSVRGHYLTFPFGARPAAVVVSYRALAASEAVPVYLPQPQLLLSLRLYAWASLTMMLWFATAIVAMVQLPDFRSPGDRVAALLLVLLFAATRGYVDWLDYHTGQEFPIFGPPLILLLFGAYVYLVRQPASVD